MKPNDKFLIGLTGGIATGKSLASHFIEMRGYKVIDFDKIAHDLLEKDQETIKDISKNFGEEVFENDKIDRKKLSKIVFEDKKKLQILNSIMHKRIYEIAIKEYKDSNSDIIFMDIPLLYETKEIWEELNLKFNEIWMITSSKEKQIQRLMIRDKITEAEAKKRVDSQLNLKEKEKLSDVVIYNNSSIENIYEDLGVELQNLQNRIQFL